MTVTTPGYIKIKKIADNRLTDSDDQVAVEEPLEIRLSYGSGNNKVIKSISVTMRTPGNDEELAVGFLFTEGIIQDIEQVSLVESIPFEDNIVMVSLKENISPVLKNTERNFYTTSSCGVCGKSSIDAIKTVSIYQGDADDIRIKAGLFYGFQNQLIKQQLIFESTGGLHAAALFNLDGNIISIREDVGRHNALDKLIGVAVTNSRLPLSNCILLLSGRASFELIQKATMAGIKIVAAVGAPSSLAVQLAKESGITLIGFLRNERFNIYSAWQRVQL